jgi:hypothetical protein
MLKYATSTIVAVFVLATSLCSAGPQIHVEKDVINDVYTYGKPTTFTFTVGNSGDQPLVIHEVKKTCRCTSVHIEREVLNPHEDTNIAITYEPDMSREEFSVKVLVKSNAANEPLKVLTIVGRNYPPNIRITPKAIILTRVIGDITEVEPVKLTIQTNNQVVLRDIRVESRNNNDGAKNESTPVFVVQKVSTEGAELNVVLQALTPREIGSYKETLNIDVETDGKTYSVSMPVELTVVPEFELIPPELVIPSTSQSATYTIRMLVKSRDRKAFMVKAVKSPEEFMETRVQKNVTGSYFIYLTIKRVVGVERKSCVVAVTLEKEDRQIELKCPIRFLEANTGL